MHVLAAFDKFKDSLSAAQACAIAGEAIRELHPDWTVESAPLTDGGEGFVDILTQAHGGRRETVEVANARLRPVQAKLGWVSLNILPAAVRECLALPAEGELAIVELAQAGGLSSLPPEERDPWLTTTFGTGELIRHAAKEGAAAILLGIGGSATNDLGLGALEALGLLAYDHRLRPVSRLAPAQWKHVSSLGGFVNVRHRFPPVRIACDVRNPLLGPRGATTVFGPQKGLRADDIPRLERQMGKMADRLLGLFGHAPEVFGERKTEAGSGAAGGIGFGLRTALPDARYVPGFSLVSEWLQLDAKLAGADLVLTGEGAFDRSSLDGKGPASILERAAAPARCHIFAGSITEDARTAMSGNPALAGMHALAPADWPLARCLREAPELLRAAVRRTFAVDGASHSPQ